LSNSSQTGNLGAVLDAPIAGSSRTESKARALIETTKPGITRLVTITSGVGFAMAGVGRNWTQWELLGSAFGCLLGTALSAAGANALNQWMERDRDARMPRTADRPIPRGTLLPRDVLVAGSLLSASGVLVLWLLAGWLPALVSLATIISYLAIYTPSKPRTQLSTIIGAFPGALPPLIGWTAASSLAGWGPLTDLGGWSLFMIMFVWQIPHFLSIAWLYRDDYRAGGHCVLPVMDASGGRTFPLMLVWTLCLIAVTLAPAVFLRDWLGLPYLFVAVVTGVAFLWFVLRVVSEKTRSAARAAFIASVIHLPVLLLAMVSETLLTRFLL